MRNDLLLEYLVQKLWLRWGDDAGIGGAGLAVRAWALLLLLVVLMGPLRQRVHLSTQISGQRRGRYCSFLFHSMGRALLVLTGLTKRIILQAMLVGSSYVLRWRGVHSRRLFIFILDLCQKLSECILIVVAKGNKYFFFSQTLYKRINISERDEIEM